MRRNPLSTLLIASCLIVLAGVPRLAAQSADKVKADVFAALSTPLPITIVGPLLTRDVEVREDGTGFRAEMKETVLMGLFPFGDVSFRLDPIDETTYRISELTFPSVLDFPGMGRISFAGMEMDGVWSTTSRSYSSLKWATTGLELSMPEGQGGSVTLGQIALDVLKEPDAQDTESRFEITARDVAMLGLGPEDIRLDGVQALLAANGEKPVDLYSLVRELMLLGGGGDTGARLEALGRSLLGNSYDTVTLDLAAQGLDVTKPRSNRGMHVRAADLGLNVTLREVLPRNWGGAEIRLSMRDVDQFEENDTSVKVEEAVFQLTGETLPVADMLTAYRLLENPPRGRAVPVSMLINGLLNFGKLEFTSGGKAGEVEVYSLQRKGEEWVKTREYGAGYDFWAVRLGLAGLDKNDGAFTLQSELRGGRLEPGEGMATEVMPHINAWFPTELKLMSQVRNLNEAMLRRLFTDVEIQNLREPVEIVAPLALYVASMLPEVSTGENAYRTNVFRITQSGSYTLYPTEVFNLMPYEGELVLRMEGLPALLDYFDATMEQMRPGSNDATALNTAKSVLIVLRNLAEDGDGADQWRVSHPDVSRNEIVVNGITFRYPGIFEQLPLLMGTFATRF